MTVFGPTDDRVYLDPGSSASWDAANVVWIEAEFEQATYRASGIIIDRNSVLTVGHGLDVSPSAGDLLSLRVTPWYDPGGEARVRTLEAIDFHTNYQHSMPYALGSPDFGVISLSEDLSRVIPAAPLGDGAGLSIGDELTAVGHPLDWWFLAMSTKGTIDVIRPDWFGTTDDADLSVGMSGAGVLDEDGNVVGLIAAEGPTINVMARIDVDQVLEWSAADDALAAPLDCVGGPGVIWGDYYILNNPDVTDAGVDPIEHYQTCGWEEGRNPNPFFDVLGYLARNPDVAAAGIDPLNHYLTYGWEEGRAAGRWFNEGAYLRDNPDVAEAGVNPLEHLLIFGLDEGREWG